MKNATDHLLAHHRSTMITVNPEPIDLDAIQTDLADVDIALQRLEDGTYWTCEITGARIDDSVLTEKPTARRA